MSHQPRFQPTISVKATLRRAVTLLTLATIGISHVAANADDEAVTREDFSSGMRLRATETKVIQLRDGKRVPESSRSVSPRLTA